MMNEDKTYKDEYNKVYEKEKKEQLLKQAQQQAKEDANKKPILQRLWNGLEKLLNRL